jgi:hypothetical protein
MSFSDLLGNAAQKLQGNGFANEIGLPTMLFDLSSVSSNDKSWVGDAFNFAGNAFRTTLQATTYPIRKPIGAAVDKVLLPAAMISYETGGRFLRQPLSAALTTLGSFDVKKSWENREEISPGQALSYLQSKWSFGMLGPDELAAGDFNIFDPNDRKVFDEDWGARGLSGAYDTFFTTVTDPLGKLGKAAGLARKAVVTRPLGAEDTNANRLLKDFLMPKSLRSVKVISPQTLARTINEGREEGGELYNTLSWFAKSDRVAIRNHPMVQQSNDADTLAYMLGEAKTVDDVADTLVATARLGTSKEIGSAAARLIAKRRDLAFVLDKINDTTDLDKKVLNNVPTNGITDDVDKLDTATELVKQVEADPYYRMIRSFNDKPADLSKRTFGKPVFEKLAISRAESKAARVKGIDKPTKFPTVGVIQPTKYHPLIAVVNFGIKKIGDTFQEKPAGYVNFNDSDSFSEMTAFGEQLRRLVGGDIAQPIIDEHTRAYLRAGGLPELRSTVAVSFEDLAISAVNRSLGLTDEQGLFIWNQYKSRRQTALDTIRDRKFLMTNDDVILKIPYLERQGANALPMVDLENYVRVLQANKGVLKSIGRKGEIIDPDSMRYVSGILNDMWKASVLLRLGYTIRNVSEATLSILGKGYGLLALGDLNRDGFKSWYNNRVQGIERLADRTLVNKGLREDSIQIRRSLAETQSEIFATEKVINEARLYAQAAERLFLQGKLNEEQYKELLELSEYLTGQYLYHGSTTPIRALDKNRPLAMSFSQDIAEQYADAGMPRISASEIYKRLSGRAYPLPKNLERSPAAEIGTQPIVERISDEAFTELNSYVNGDFGDVQAGLRDPNFAVSRGKNVPELPKGLQRTIQRSVLTKPLTVYRGTTNRNSPFATAQVGDIIEEPAFVSTTYNDNVARNFATPSTLKIGTSEPSEAGDYISTQIEMKLPKGLNALDIAETYNQMKNLGYANLQRESMLMVNRESEVLLPAGTKFRVLSRGGDAENGYAVTVEAILPPKTPKRPVSPSMQTIGSDMREGFINTVNNGNVVEVLNPQTGRWTTVDPNTVSQKLLTTAEFRIRKPGNQGAVISQKVYGTEVDLRTENLRSPRLNLVDYPELKNVLGIEKGTPRNRAAWEGKEKALLDWMRANGVGKVILPDNKANGRATVLVDPEMVEGFGESPFVTLTQRRLDSVKRQQQILGNEPRMLSIIERTIKNQGGTFDFAGDVPVEGISVAVRGATHTFKLEDASANPQGWIDSVAAHFEKNLEKFGKADHFGTWVEDIDGVPHIWAEPTNVIMDRAQAVKLGVERNQKSVADLAAIARGDWDNAFIVTRGTGDEGATARFALGQGTEASRGNVTARAEGLRPTLSGKSTRERIAELSESLSSKREYPTAGLAQIVREAADMQAVSKKNLENLLVKLDARVVEETRIGAPKQIQGTGRRIVTLYDGTKVEIDDAFRGELGQILYDRTDNTDSYRRFVDHPSQFFAAEHNNFVEDVLTPNMPDYYSGWANQLNTFFRSPDGRIDPLVEQMLNGARPEEIVKWLRKPENVGYARRFNIDVPGIKVPSERLNASIEAEDFVGDLYSAFNRYLPDAQMQEAFRAGQVTEIWLRNHFKNATELPDIVGRIVPTSPQARNIMDATAKVIDKAFYFLGSLPETTLARHPLARAIYRSDYQDRLDVALSTKRLNTGNTKAELTVDEINNLRRDVVESTRKEVNKTLFTIIRKSYAGEKMRFIMPFFNAWENTIRRWSGLATENPAVVARAGQIVSSLRNQPNVIDAEGNPTNEFSYDNKIVVPMSEGAISAIEKIPVWGKGMAEAIRATGTQVSIPVRSLDVLFQGEYLAGFGPLVVMPVNELVKAKPDLEDIFTSSVLPVLPFGTQEGVLRQLLPPAAQKLASLAGQDELWSRTFNTVYRYELIKYNLGERESMPSLEEVSKLTNDFYKVRILSNLVMPFAAQYDSPLSFYSQQFRKLQDVYGRDAEVLFLEMYPEMGPALVSSSFNPTGAQASQKAFGNIKKYGDLVSQIGQTAPEMIGFLVNDPDGKYDFSEAVYAWQYGNAPVPGSTDKFRERRDPAQLKRDANIKVGWIEFRKNMNLLDSQLQAQGYQSYSESGAEELQALKQLMVTDLSQRNPDWQADYLNVDRGKWIYRMQAMRSMLSNPKWMSDNGNRQVVQAMAIYLQARGQVARELQTRKSYGAASTLAAEDNADLDGYWNSVIYQLKTGSPEFEDFFNRFLQNDPVTLG